MTVASRFLGMVSMERGKRGFKEADVYKTKGFVENLQTSAEMVERASFDGENEVQMRVLELFSSPYIFDMGAAVDQKPLIDEKMVPLHDAIDE